MATDRYNKNLQAILDQSKLKINDKQLGALKNLQQYLIDILTEVAAPERAPNEVKEIMMPYVFQCHKLFEKSPELIKVSKNIMLDLETSIIRDAPKAAAEFIKEYTDRVLGKYDIPLASYRESPPKYENENLCNEIIEILKPYSNFELDSDSGSGLKIQSLTLQFFKSFEYTARISRTIILF